MSPYPAGTVGVDWAQVLNSMYQREELPTILMIMLCMRCRLGGAEKRYARVFEMLVAQPGAQHKLLINRSMLNLLQAAGILSNHEPYLIVLEPPFRRYAQSQKGYLSRRWISRILRPLMWLLDASWCTWRCWRVIRRHKSALVHPLLTGVYFSFPALLFHPQVRFMMSAYSYQFESYRDKHVFGVALGATVKRYAMHRCHAIDALSVSIRNDLVSRGIDNKKIQVAPCSFTDLSLCRPTLHRKKWVVFLGRFVNIKNPLLLARAIPQVLAQDPDAHFYFLGEGYLQLRLESMVRDLGVTNHVTVRFEPNPTRILNQSSIFVSLQAEENYPSQSLLEAMACGNAIVATNVGETLRLVDESNGVLITPDAGALANAILDLLRDPQLSQRNAASRERILTEHTAERFFEHISGMYQTIVKAQEQITLAST